jgi:hypothetical protein
MQQYTDIEVASINQVQQEMGDCSYDIASIVLTAYTWCSDS